MYGAVKRNRFDFHKISFSEQTSHDHYLLRILVGWSWTQCFLLCLIILYSNQHEEHISRHDCMYVKNVIWKIKIKV